MEDEQQNRVIVWAESEAFFKQELKDEGSSDEEWTYKGEYMFVFSMDESGRKIKRIMEFLDSKAAEHARNLVKRATANLRRREEVKKKESMEIWEGDV